MPDTPTDPIAVSAERFARETEHHALTILHDDGLYRHVRCMAPSPMGSAYWFELVTVPGSLTFRGDSESYSFARLTDMFEFFRSNPDRLTHRISPDYWAEKLTSSPDAVKVYSREKFASLVAEHLKEAEKEYPGVTAAWAEAIELDYDTDYEESARPALEGFEYRPDGAKPNSEPFRFYDTYEWDLRDFDWWYLWACHAIVWGIAQYDQAKRPIETLAVSL